MSLRGVLLINKSIVTEFRREKDEQRIATNRTLEQSGKNVLSITLLVEPPKS